MRIYFVFHSVFTTLTFGRRYSRSKKLKYIWFFVRKIVPLQAESCVLFTHMEKKTCDQVNQPDH